jgi:AcrR family transcriptional regulator
MTANPAAVGGPANTKDLILDVALHLFAEHGLAGTSLNDIADEVGIRRPSLLHHFPSKEALYKAVVMRSFADWFALVEEAVAGNDKQGWPQVERILRAAFQFFEEHPEFVRLARREALDGGPILSEELGVVLRPLFDRGANFLTREMDAGRLRRYDPRELLIMGYGAILSYLSDAALISSLVDDDPLSPASLKQWREHVIDVFRNALAA